MQENVFYVFFRFQKRVWSESRKKSSVKYLFSRQSFEMSLHTSLNDHCNSVPSHYQGVSEKKTAWVFSNISKQLVFETKIWPGYDANIIS